MEAEQGRSATTRIREVLERIPARLPQHPRSVLKTLEHPDLQIHLVHSRMNGDRAAGKLDPQTNPARLGCRGDDLRDEPPQGIRIPRIGFPEQLTHPLDDRPDVEIQDRLVGDRHVLRRLEAELHVVHDELNGVHLETHQPRQELVRYVFRHGLPPHRESSAT